MYIMRKYTVSVVRERLAEALDQAERGEPVFIERRGVTYRLTAETARPMKRKAREPLIEVLDPAVEKGEWSWNWDGGRLRFRARR